MRNTKSAFTLVELIVVITILAILGTIAFISLQGYSAEARNAKRTSDLSSITSALSVKITKGMGALSAVSDDSNANNSIDLAGKTGLTSSSDYEAGKVNYTALEMKASEFKDPDGDDYRIGATTLAGGVFEVAATVELDGGNSAMVTGMFNPRTALNNPGTLTGTISAGSEVFKLSDITKTGYFKVKDTVTINSVDLIINKISSDGMNLTLSGIPGGTTIALANYETAGLISDATGSGVVVNNGSVLPY